MQKLSLDALRTFAGVGPVDVWQSSTALVLIDMQNRLIRPDGFSCMMLRARGLEDAAQQYERQLAVAIPNLRSVLERARSTGQPVVHVRAVKLHGRQTGGMVEDRSRPPEGPHAFEIIDELTPHAGEPVIDKTCSGVFAGSNLDYLLRRLGVSSLIVGGVVTNGCVEQAITQAHDLGYACILPSDACAALTDEIHVNALERLYHRRAHVLPTAELIRSEHLPQSSVAVPESAVQGPYR